MTLLRKLIRDESGGALVEAAIVIWTLLVLTGGILDFFAAANQWNTAVKAVERGARLAAVSTPIDERIRNVCTTACAGLEVGDSLSGVQWVSTCAGATQTCSVTGTDAGVVTGAAGSAYNAAAMNLIVNGRNNPNLPAVYRLGMAQVCCGLPPWGAPITANNVTVIYEGTGLGFVGRPTGAVPTITVRLTNSPFNFVFLRIVPGFTNITMPPISVTVTGEDLFTNGVPPPA